MPDGPPEAPARPGWTVGDFVLVFVSGLVGAFAAAFAFIFTEDPDVIFAAGILAQQAGYLLGLWGVVKRRKARFADLGLDVRPTDGLYLLAGMALEIGVALLFFPVASLIDPEGSAQALVQDIPSLTGTYVRSAVALSLVLIGPVTEELMFRGLLLRIAHRFRGRAFAVVTSALAFAIVHLLGVRDADPVVVLGLLIPQLFLVGVVLAMLAYRHGRLGVPIFTHAGFNLVGVLFLFFAPELAGA